MSAVIDLFSNFYEYVIPRFPELMRLLETFIKQNVYELAKIGIHSFEQILTVDVNNSRCLGNQLSSEDWKIACDEIAQHLKVTMQLKSAIYLGVALQLPRTPSEVLAAS